MNKSSEISNSDAYQFDDTGFDLHGGDTNVTKRKLRWTNWKDMADQVMNLNVTLQQSLSVTKDSYTELQAQYNKLAVNFKHLVDESTRNSELLKHIADKYKITNMTYLEREA